MLLSGERQVAASPSGVRRDHAARYEWAAKQLGPGTRVIDLGCGVGYGSWILAEAGCIVTAIDIDAETIAYAKANYAHPGITYRCGGLCPELVGHEAAVAFEVIEHVEHPLFMLKSLAGVDLLLASVPNEDEFPYLREYAFHRRHYRASEFEALLKSAGFQATEWLGQAGPESEVEPGAKGRTLIARARKVLKIVESKPAAAPVATPSPAPDHVCILGLGPSLAEYVNIAKCLGSRHKLADEVWGINAVGDVITCDRIFHMDDVAIQEIRAAAKPGSNIANMLGWIKKHPGPIYTSIVRDGYPGLVAYPLEDVLNDLGYGYLNNTAAHAVAFAIHLGVKKISLFGCDFTYPNAHDAEKGRGCVEFWLGFARARGIEILLPANTSLLDGAEPEDRRIYGYDAVHLEIAVDDDGNARVGMIPREKLPTAEEIEARYDHTKHPNALISGGS